MVENATTRRQPSGGIPVLLKCIVCGFFSFGAWLLASQEEIGRGGSIGLFVVSAVCGLFAVAWLAIWIHSLGATYNGSDDDAMISDDRCDDEAGHGSFAPFETPAGMEFSFDNEEPEETPVADRRPREQGGPSDDFWFEVILGWIGDILSLFPLFVVAVTMTPLLVYYVAVTIAGWIGLIPQWEWNGARLLVIPMFFLTLGFAWHWRSQLTEKGASRLRNTIFLVGSAEFAALCACSVLSAVGALVFILGQAVEIW